MRLNDCSFGYVCVVCCFKIRFYCVTFSAILNLNLANFTKSNFLSSKMSCKMSSRRLQDLFARRLQDVFEDVKLLLWRRAEDVFKTNKCLLGRLFYSRSVEYSFVCTEKILLLGTCTVKHCEYSWNILVHLIFPNNLSWMWMRRT